MTGPRPSRWLTWLRVGLGLAGLAVLVAIVRGVGVRVLLDTLRPALLWLPVLCVIEVARVACETVGSYAAFGSLAPRIPRATLFRAHVIANGVGSLAPAPRVVVETIKAGLLVPFVGGAAVTSVGFINQAATLLAVALLSIPCGAALFVENGPSFWVWASAIHAVAIGGSGLALQAVTRAGAPGRWLGRRFPRFAARLTAVRAHALETGLWARGPTTALLVGRLFQTLQYGIAARAVGIDAGVVRALAAEGVNLVASAVGVLVPAGIGTTDGAFALAADALGTTVARATSLALLIRCNQLLWLLIGSLVALVGGRGAPPRGRTSG